MTPMNFRSAVRRAAVWLAFASPLMAVPGDVDPAFNPNVTGVGGGAIAPSVLGVALQPGGGVVFGGSGFNMVGGATRNNLARVNADGVLDGAWDPKVTGSFVIALAALENGRTLIGGTFTDVGGAGRPRLALINANGSVNGDFAPEPNGAVHSISAMEDGRILIGGEFRYVAGQARGIVARLNADGTLDASFNPGTFPTSSWLYCVARQADGKVLIAGWFTSVAGVTRSHMARLAENGALDTAFNPSFNDEVRTIAVQPDGKILVGGKFTQACGQNRPRIARLNADGTLDTSFNPTVTDTVTSITLQADGKIIFAEGLASIDVNARNRIARVNPDGATDATFQPVANKIAIALQIQADGRVVVGGNFITAGGVTRNRICRLLNDPAISELTAPAPERVRWIRGGTSPEALYVRFEYSVDGGASWTSLGSGTRIAGGWEKTGIHLPPGSGLLRARARTTNGKGAGSLVETVSPFSFLPPNQPPQLSGYHFATAPQTPAAIAARKVLAKASDPDNDAVSLTAAGPSSARGGTVVLANGNLLYTPPAGFSGEDSFPITLTDARGASAQATVGVIVTAATPVAAGGASVNPPKLRALEGGRMELTFHGIPGRVYQIQRSSDLGIWHTLATVSAGPEGSVSHIDNGPLPPNAYYRLAWSTP